MGQFMLTWTMTETSIWSLTISTNLHLFIKMNLKNAGNHYLGVKLEGSGKITDGLALKLFAFNQGKMQYLEQMPARGFQVRFQIFYILD